MTITELQHYAEIAEGMGSRDMANALRTADRELIRLRAELDKERQRRFDGNQIASEEARTESREQQNEIERLRAELAELQGGMTVAYMQGASAKAEEMRAELDALYAMGAGDAERSEAYDAIDRFLRSSLDDDEYAEYSSFLETVWGSPRPAIPDGWMPIETAPKDGTEVALLFAAEDEVIGHRVPRVRSASWSGDWAIPYYRTNPPISWHPLPVAPKQGDAK